MGDEQKQENNQTVIINMPQTPPPVTPKPIPQPTPQKKKRTITKKWMIRIIIGSILCPIIVALVVRHCIENRPDSGTTTHLSFRSWQDWGGVQVIANGNTVTLNGKIDVGGCFSEQLSPTLRGKTIILEILNTEASDFSIDRLIKITVNRRDQVVWPLNVPYLIAKEYIPFDYQKVEFILPNDFDGKLGFVFYQADLRDLKITMQFK